MYTSGNPVNYVDPSGLILEGEAQEARDIIDNLRNYGITVKEDFGYILNTSITTPLGGSIIIQCGWRKGYWDLWQLQEVEKAILEIDKALNYNFYDVMGQTDLIRVPIGFAVNRAYANDNNVVLPDAVFFYRRSETPALEHIRYTVAHEYGHIWDWRHAYGISARMRTQVENRYLLVTQAGPIWFREWIEEPLTEYGNKNQREDWAETFAAYIYPTYVARLEGGRNILDPDASIRRQFVIDEINSIP